MPGNRSPGKTGIRSWPDSASSDLTRQTQALQMVTTRLYLVGCCNPRTTRSNRKTQATRSDS